MSGSWAERKVGGCPGWPHRVGRNEAREKTEFRAWSGLLCLACSVKTAKGLSQRVLCILGDRKGALALCTSTCTSIQRLKLVGFSSKHESCNSQGATAENHRLKRLHPAHTPARPEIVHHLPQSTYFRFFHKQRRECRRRALRAAKGETTGAAIGSAT